MRVCMDGRVGLLERCMGGRAPTAFQKTRGAGGWPRRPAGGRGAGGELGERLGVRPRPLARNPQGQVPRFGNNRRKPSPV